MEGVIMMFKCFCGVGVFLKLVESFVLDCFDLNEFYVVLDLGINSC